MLIIAFLLCGHHLIHKVNLTFSLNKNKIRVLFSSLIVHLNYSYKQHKLNKSEIKSVWLTLASYFFFFGGEGGSSVDCCCLFWHDTSYSGDLLAYILMPKIPEITLPHFVSFNFKGNVYLLYLIFLFSLWTYGWKSFCH